MTLTAALILTLAAGGRRSPADEPKKADGAPKAAEPGTLLVIDAAGKEHKLKSWKFTAGVRPLTWLASAKPPEKEPEGKDKGKDAEPGPRAKAASGPEALVMREENSTVWANGVLTLVPLDRIRAIDFDAEKETVTVRVARADNADKDLVLTGSTKFQGINKLAIDAEVDKGELGVAEVRFLGGSSKGIRGVRFPPPKPAAEAKDGRPAAVTYGDRNGKQVVNVSDLQALYRVADGAALSPLVMFKKTLKIDLAKIKKITPNKEEMEPVWAVALKSGDEETLVLLSRVQLDGKDAQLEGLLGKVPAGYKLFPVHLLYEVEFDVTKDAGEAKPKPDDK